MASSIALAARKRFQFLQDDDCHWYMVPAGSREAFDQWVHNSEEEDFPGPDFEKYRVGGGIGNYSFADHREDS